MVMMMRMMMMMMIIIIFKEMGVKLDNEHRYDHVPKLVETSHEGKVTTLWNQQVQSDNYFKQ
jgi:hypothetical protein